MDMSPLSPHTHAINIIKCEISISDSDGNELIKKRRQNKNCRTKMPTKNPMIGNNFFSLSKLNRDEKKRVKDEGKNGALFGHLIDHGIEELYH